MSSMLNRPPESATVELLAAVAHDLLQPLTVVRVGVGLLRHRVEYPETAPAASLDEGLTQIEEAGLRMEQLVDELLDLARGQAGCPLPLRRQQTDLAELAARAARAHTLGGRRRVQLELDPPTVRGRWDAARLCRVLDNLLSNALKYSPPGYEVVLRVGREVQPDGDWAVVTVRDHGRGIPAAEQPRIFTPFWRGAESRQMAGSGLGLASVRQIVEAHGGSVTVRSHEGQGTTVTVQLPRE
jgi:signal transduction histidine kinase